VKVESVGPFRCSNCTAYVTRHCTFSSHGHKVKCCLCNHEQDVPAEHYGTIDEMGHRTDGEQNPQYQYGAYEFIMSEDWVETQPVLPAFVFCVDVSSTAIINGFFGHTIQTIKQCLDYFPNPE